jgi:hypothetical protein
MIKAICDSHNQTEYIVVVPDLVSESAFLQRAAVRPNSYAWRLASNIYRDIFIKSLDLKRDFDLYYKIEYGDFGEYLRKRHLLHREDAADIATEYKNSAAILRYNRPYSFLEDDPGETLLETLLDVKGNQ